MRHKIKIGILFCLLVTAAHANQRYNNSCQQGGKQVTTSGVTGTPRVQGSYPQCQVTVYSTGTLTLATLFSDNSGTAKANPFTANTDGSYFFYAANGRYDVTMSGGGLPAPVTLGDVLLADPFAGGGSVTSFNGRTGVVLPATNDYSLSQINGWPTGSETQFLRRTPNNGATAAYSFATLPGPTYSTADYNFSVLTPTGSSSLTGGLAATVTLTPCPLGLNWNDLAHYVRIAGTGTPETVLITAAGPGTCTSGASSGTVTFTPANAHTPGWTLGPASFGVQEAVVVAQTAGGGTILIPPGTYTLLATIRISVSNTWLKGGGMNSGTIINRTADFGDSILVDAPTPATLHNINISDFGIYQTVNYAEGPPATISNRPTSGAHVKIQNCSYCSVHDIEAMWMPYGIELDTVGWTHVYNNTLKSVWDYATAGVQVGIAAIYLHHSESGAGYPTYLWVDNNVILGPGSASRNITVNGNSITLVEPVGAKDGILVEACELCWIRGNSIEWQNSNGINIKAAAPHSVADALLVIDISNNYIDRNRTNGIVFDMSADEIARFALGVKIHNNWILGSGATINLIKFTGAATPPTYVRVAQETVIADNILRFGLGSAIYMLGGTNTKIIGNIIHGYNELNSYPLNTLTCSGVSGVCTGDRLGNSGIFMSEAVIGTTVTGNTIGGNYLGTAYAGGAFTVNGVTIGQLIYQSVNEGDTITAPNTNGGVQIPSSRSVAAAYDPAFFFPPGPIFGASRSSVAVSVCGSLNANSTIQSGLITSGTTGACAPVLTFTNATAANGWACSISNRTTANLIRQTASSTSTVTFGGTTNTSDVLSYACTAY